MNCFKIHPTWMDDNRYRNKGICLLLKYLNDYACVSLRGHDDLMLILEDVCGNFAVPNINKSSKLWIGHS